MWHADKTIEAHQDLWPSAKARVTRFKKTSGSAHCSKSGWDKTGVFLLITGCTGAANDWEGKASGHGCLHCSQQKMNMCEEFNSLDDLIRLPMFYIQLEPHRYDNILPQYTILPRVQFPFVHMFTVMGFWGKNKIKSLPHCEEEMHTDVLL